jgi:hypothetical protein
MVELWLLEKCTYARSKKQEQGSDFHETLAMAGKVGWNEWTVNS